MNNETKAAAALVGLARKLVASEDLTTLVNHVAAQLMLHGIAWEDFEHAVETHPKIQWAKKDKKWYATPKGSKPAEQAKPKKLYVNIWDDIGDQEKRTYAYVEMDKEELAHLGGDKAKVAILKVLVPALKAAGFSARVANGELYISSRKLRGSDLTSNAVKACMAAKPVFQGIPIDVYSES